MDKKFKVGVIGVGSIAQIGYLPVLSSMEEVEITGIMSKNPENARRSQVRYGVKNVVETLEQLIKLNIDCAIVLTPKQIHAQQVVPLLEAGIDVFCEKPLAMTLKESEVMVEVAIKTGKKLMVGFNRRFAPVYRQAKEAYEELIPDVVVAHKNRPASEYRATLENAIHMVDLMRYICGECERLKAFSKFTDPYYETLTTAQLKFSSGAIGMLVADRSSGQWIETMELHGHNRSVYVCAPDRITVVDNEGFHTTDMTPLAMGYARLEDKFGFRPAIEHFFECIKTNTQPLTNAEDAFKTHELMHRILESAGLPDLS